MNNNFEAFNRAFTELRQTVHRIWSDIEIFLHELRETREGMEIEKRLKKTWHVPKNIVRGHQVIDRKPSFVRVRSQI